MNNSKNKWIRIFQIPEFKAHPTGYTIYQVTCCTFPVEFPEQATTVSTWKRFSQFQSLHKILATVHKQLFLHGIFPTIPSTGYFNRKNPEVIEVRRVWCLNFLEWVATQPLLNTHPTFTNFLFDFNDSTADDSSECSSLPRHNSMSSLVSTTSGSKSPGDVSVKQDLSLDTTPVLIPNMAFHDDSSTDFIRGESLTRESEDLIAAIDEATIHRHDHKESLENLASLVADLPSDTDVPTYISEAALLISDALRFEAEELFEDSLSSYRSAIGKLLGNVQSDSDVLRQAQVKRRIAQYISKAEQIVNRQSELGTRKINKRSPGIPHLQLFGQLNELKQYKVKEILANKIILAENRLTKELVIFKTLHKSPAVYKKTKTSLLPINITYMVCLIKYFETDDCVFLMLEYCTPGTLWDIVKPLVLQTSQMVVIDNDTPIRNLEDQYGESTLTKPQTSIIKASKSFIQDRKISITTYSESCDNIPDCDNTNISDDNSNDSFDDISVVHTNNDSMLVVTNDQIEHFDGYVEHDFDDEKMYTPENILLKNSKKMLDSISKTLSKNDIGAKNVLDKLDSIENRIKLHIKGEISPDDYIPPLQSTPTTKTIISPCVTPPVFSSPIHTKTTDMVVCPAHPRVLRKLSELLPQCPDPELLNSTMLPDRLIRTWAAEIAQVLSSLHYREILVRDLNPSNVLLDSSGHVKLTYQCEWVSVDTELDQSAVNDHFCAPEVVSVGDLTPAADWWSYGALLHLLYCGHSPSSVLATGVDSSIPLGSFPQGLAEEVKQFISDLLQPAPEQRLGAGSRGSHDVRVHPFFHGWNWERMSWNRN